jgi:hypothetical protein
MRMNLFYLPNDIFVELLRGLGHCLAFSYVQSELLGKCPIVVRLSSELLYYPLE